MCQCLNVCLVPLKARSKHGSLGTGATGSCELLCGCWELSPGLLQELVTAGAAPQSFCWILFIHSFIHLFIYWEKVLLDSPGWSWTSFIHSFIYWEKVLLGSPGWSWTSNHPASASPRLVLNFQPSCLKSWDDSVHHHTELQICSLTEARRQGPHKDSHKQAWKGIIPA